MSNIKDNIIHMLYGSETEIKNIKKIIKTYGDNIEQIADIKGKKVVLLLKEIIETDDDKALNSLYEKCKEMETFDLEEVKKELKQYFGGKLMDDLYQPKETDLIPQNDLPEELRNIGVPVYNAGTDFRMMVSARGDGIDR